MQHLSLMVSILSEHLNIASDTQFSSFILFIYIVTVLLCYNTFWTVPPIFLIVWSERSKDSYVASFQYFSSTRFPFSNSIRKGYIETKITNASSRETKNEIIGNKYITLFILAIKKSFHQLNLSKIQIKKLGSYAMPFHSFKYISNCTVELILSFLSQNRLDIKGKREEDESN